MFADSRPRNRHAVFRFSCLDHLAACAACLPDTAEASLYFLDGSFYLGIPHCTARDAAALSEYGDPVQNPEHFLSTVLEHGRTLSTHGTVERLRRIG